MDWLRLFDLVGLGVLAIVAANYCFALFGFVTGQEVIGVTDPIFFIVILIFTIWGFWSLFRLPKYMNHKKTL